MENNQEHMDLFGSNPCCPVRAKLTGLVFSISNPHH